MHRTWGCESPGSNPRAALGGGAEAQMGPVSLVRCWPADRSPLWLKSEPHGWGAMPGVRVTMGPGGWQHGRAPPAVELREPESQVTVQGADCFTAPTLGAQG